MSEAKFEEWCIVEVMGHKRFAGRVTEQVLSGHGFIRVDVPDAGAGKPAFTKLIGPGSIYAISPVSEQVARAAAQSSAYREEPVSRWCLDVPEPPLALPGPVETPTWRDTDTDTDEEVDPEADEPHRFERSELDEGCRRCGLDASDSLHDVPDDAPPEPVIAAPREPARCTQDRTTCTYPWPTCGYPNCLPDPQSVEPRRENAEPKTRDCVDCGRPVDQAGHHDCDDIPF